jgi:TetR/AcrR family transcriptional repressor of nem operon
MSKAEKTRAFIIEKAAPIFNTKGYAGTSMSDLTEATGLTKGAIYGNFENKDEVAVAVYEYNLSLVVKGLTAVMEQHTHSIAKLRAMANFYRENYKQTLTRGGCPILNTAVEAADNHPLLKKCSTHTLLSWKETIEKIVAKGKTNGEIKPDADGCAFGATFIALIEGGVMLSKATGNTKMLNDCILLIERLIEQDLEA